MNIDYKAAGKMMADLIAERRRSAKKNLLKLWG